MLQESNAGTTDQVTCTFVKAVTGDEGDVIDDVVTVTGVDDDGDPVTDSDDASVTITDVPSTIVVDKTANPTSLPEPGGNVTFTVVVTNTSVTDDVTFDVPADFTDAVEGGAAAAISDIDCNGATTGNGFPVVLQESNAGTTDQVTCTFVKAVTGDEGDVIDDVVTVTGVDDDGDPVTDSDDASVTITDVPSTIVVDKTANPTSLPEPGGNVTFTVVVTNTSVTDDVTFDVPADFTDAVEGGAAAAISDIDCNGATTGNGFPVVLQESNAGTTDQVTCTFVKAVTGDEGDVIDDVVTVTGVDDDGDPVTDSDDASVTITPNPGTIIIEKQTNPNGDPATFDFTGEIVTTLGDEGTASKSVGPGTYSVTEAAKEGWTLTAGRCDDQNSGLNFDTRSATIRVEPGETVKCTFENTKDGQITIEKQTLPDGYQTDSFFFSGAIDALLDDNESATRPAFPGTYTVTEAERTFWDLVSIVCDDADSAGNPETLTATFRVDPGEIVKCTFTNQKQGDITVFKQTIPDGSQQSFAFAASYDQDGFSLTDGQSNWSGGLTPGTYSVSESVPPGWNLQSAVCDDGSPVNAIKLEAAEDIICTFTNTQSPTVQGQGAIAIVKTANPTSVKEPGGPVNFTVTISNPSSVPIVVTEVTDSVFGNLENVFGGNPAGCFDLPINLGPNGGASTCSFTRQVTGVGGQTHINVATAKGHDFFGHNLEASDDARVIITPKVMDLVIVKDANPTTVALNSIFKYTLTVSNKGPDTATNVVVADPAPSGVAYVGNVTTTKGTCNLTPNPNPVLLTCNLGDLAAGQSVTITLDARATAVGTHTNTATVTGGGGEANPADNTDTATINVPAPIRPPTARPQPPAPVCLTLTVAPKMIKADGKVDRVSVKVTAGKKRVKGTKVAVFGAGVRKTARSNSNGMAFLRINPKRAGLITITALETNQKVCGPKRIGVVGVFLPPLTG